MSLGCPSVWQRLLWSRFIETSYIDSCSHIATLSSLDTKTRPNIRSESIMEVFFCISFWVIWEGMISFHQEKTVKSRAKQNCSCLRMSTNLLSLHIRTTGKERSIIEQRFKNHKSILDSLNYYCSYSPDLTLL